MSPVLGTKRPTAGILNKRRLPGIFFTSDPGHRCKCLIERPKLYRFFTTFMFHGGKGGPKFRPRSARKGTKVNQRQPNRTVWENQPGRPGGRLKVIPGCAFSKTLLAFCSPKRRAGLRPGELAMECFQSRQPIGATVPGKAVQTTASDTGQSRHTIRDVKEPAAALGGGPDARPNAGSIAQVLAAGASRDGRARATRANPHLPAHY